MFMKTNRRKWLAGCSSAALMFPFLRSNSENISEHLEWSSVIATNTYPWFTFARRENKDFKIHSNELLNDISKTGIQGYEPILNSADELEGLQTRLKNNHLSMYSFYVNSELHEPALVEKSIPHVLRIAESAKGLGSRIVVTNPTPLQWGGKENKSDKQLRTQSRALDMLGAELRKIGMTLAYHFHDAEFRAGGREFHHMLSGTSFENVKLCLDAHWIYRGCSDSEVAVFDALKMYGKRIVELHLRQSIDGHWSEAFTMQGDIHYPKIMEHLHRLGIKPYMVLEQAVENKSPRTMNVVQAHTSSFKNLKKA